MSLDRLAGQTFLVGGRHETIDRDQRCVRLIDRRREPSNPNGSRDLRRAQQRQATATRQSGHRDRRRLVSNRQRSRCRRPPLLATATLTGLTAFRWPFSRSAHSGQNGNRSPVPSDQYIHFSAITSNSSTTRPHPEHATEPGSSRLTSSTREVSQPSTTSDRRAVQPGPVDEALARIGFDGERLLRLAYGVAHHFCRRTNTGLDTPTARIREFAMRAQA